MTKWGDRPHWEFDGTFLGSDEHGDWLGTPAGTLNARPGARFVSRGRRGRPRARAPADRAVVPGDVPRRPADRCTVYVDITTPPIWDGPWCARSTSTST